MKDQEKVRQKKEKAEEFRREKSGTSKTKNNHVHFRRAVNENLSNKNPGNRRGRKMNKIWDNLH